jgi:hypothetical protein
MPLDEYAEQVSAKKIERLDREFRAKELTWYPTLG